MVPDFTAEWAAGIIRRLDATPGAGKIRGGTRIGAHPAVAFILLCEVDLHIPRQAFRAVLADAVQRDPVHAQYFLKHPHVFTDWLYGVRPLPSWAARTIAEVGIALLCAGRFPRERKTRAERLIREIVARIVGGEEWLEWVLKVVAALS